ncbi:MAG TPA: TadE/TadG family type IV pilus assembly protein [Acetobacteraceae bacterium]|nr:TadE/TadG family type IV pilus assembly protein [Acetobacteraceae bacterium]
MGTRRARDRAGVTALEFAFIAPVLLALAALLIEAGWQLATQAALEYGARQAARFGATGSAVPASLASVTPPPTRAQAITQLVTQAGHGIIDGSRLSVSVQSFAGFPVIGQAGAATPGPGGGGAVAQYALVYQQPYLTGFGQAILGSSFQLHHANLVVQNEPFPR